MRQADLRQITDAHNTYWDFMRSEMRGLTRAYRGTMFKSRKDRWGDINIMGDSVTVETADGYAYVESYVASLFAKSPAVAVAAGPQEGEDPGLVEAIANDFLYRQVVVCEGMVRAALIYPNSAVKLGVVNSNRTFDRVQATVVHPWDLLIDMDAPRWDLQRYVGHRYYLPIKEARTRWGTQGVKKWKPAVRRDYLEDASGAGDSTGIRQKYEAAQSMDPDSILAYVEIYEMYDLVNNKVTWWSPDTEVNEGILATEDIPYSWHDGTPCIPIIPMYASHDPQVPLRGGSALRRVYDQLVETNLLRTYWANAVRRDARVYLVRKDALNDHNKAILAANRDGSCVEVEIGNNDALSSIITPIQNIPISNNLNEYQNEIRADLQRGSVLAPFTRGVSTNATATEISALTQYTATEIGRIARQRDLAIETIAATYIRMLVVLMVDPETGEPEKEVYTYDGRSVVVTPEVLDGSYRYAAADQSSTPISSAMRRMRIAEVAPLLQSLGVEQRKLLEYIVREFDLPKDLLPEDVPATVDIATVQTEPNVLAPQPGAESVLPENGAIPVGGGETASVIRSLEK